MSTLFRQGYLVQFDPPMVMFGDLLVEDGYIVEVGEDLSDREAEEVLHMNGAVLMPGLVNGHTHLYSALAVGMPAPPRVPQSFHDILELIWWRLDRAHSLESVEMSGVVGAMRSVRCGVTTVIDHHASPSCIEGSLDALERGIERVGGRGVLCYEVTDRNGCLGAEAGLLENERYAERCRDSGAGCFGSMIGAHASFTLEDTSLNSCVTLAKRFGTGVHIHAAEDPVDDRITREKYGYDLFERFERCGLFDVDGSIVAHGTHFTEIEIERFNACAGRVGLAHAPRSNMNNSVGYTPIARFDPGSVLLGTDGIDGDVIREAQCAYFRSRDAGLAIDPAFVLKMIGRSAATASAHLGVRVGVLEVGAAADLVVTKYRPTTPLSVENLGWHLLFGFGAEMICDVMVDGRWVVRGGSCVNVDESEVSREAVGVARGLFERMECM